MKTVVLRRHARHEGRRVRVPARPAARRTASTCCSSTPAIHEPVGIEPDVARDEVARAAGADVAALAAARRPRRRRRRRWRAGAEAVVLAAPRRRAGSTACSRSAARAARRSRRRAMRALPVGVPKLMVSTLASGDTRPYVGAVDVTMMYSVVDIAGVNRISARIMANAAGAIAGMVARHGAAARDEAARRRDDVRRHDAVRDAGARSGSRSSATRCSSSTRPAPAASRWRRSSEAGFLAGVLDVTTTELADELVGGVLSAGPDRLEAAGDGGRAAGRLARRARHGQLRAARDGPGAVRGPQPLRPQPDGDADADDAGGVRASSGARSARKLSAATGPTALFVPLRGVSMIAVDGQPFHDPEADEALLAGPARDARPARRAARAATTTSTTRRSPTRWPTGCTS